MACKEEQFATGISLNGYTSENPLECTMGNFAYDNYTLTVTYDDGETKEIALTEDMISETDKLKFYQEGRSSITITYEGVETSIELNVLRNQFSDNIQLKDFTATYNGKPYVVEVEGDIPGGTKILYPQGNTFQNAGEYDMTAVLQCDGYVTKVLSARVNIEKATYDVTNAQLYDETVVYNKDSHSLTIKGKPFTDENGKVIYNVANIPQGVRVNYTITKVVDGKGNKIDANKQQVVEGNKAIDAGVYEVRAQFKGDASNYKTISDSVAYLTIERNTYDLSKVVFDDNKVTYSGKSYELSIPTDSKMPSDVVVSYQIKQIKNANGEGVKSEYKSGNTATKVGVYLVKATFNVTGKNAENYTASPNEKEAYLTIERDVYNMANVEFFDDVVMYTGEPQSLSVSNDSIIPKDVDISYEIKQIKNANGDNVADEYKPGNTGTDVGVYSVKVTFKIIGENAENYTTSPYEKVATLTIIHALYDETIGNINLESQWYQFKEEQEYEIYIDCNLPLGVLPVFTITDESGQIIVGEMKSDSNAEGLDTHKTRYAYTFKVEKAGTYACTVTFKHNNVNYADIKIELNAWIYISAEA